MTLEAALKAGLRLPEATNGVRVLLWQHGLTWELVNADTVKEVAHA
jgi:hypothetical protein